MLPEDQKYLSSMIQFSVKMNAKLAKVKTHLESSLLVTKMHSIFQLRSVRKFKDGLSIDYFKLCKMKKKHHKSIPLEIALA